MKLGFAVVHGLSMIPSFAPGEIVLVRYGAKYLTGDVVLIKASDRIDIKRVTHINSGQVFVEGDNLAVSIDSRSYGEINDSQVIGKVIYRLPRWLKRRGIN